MIGHVSTGGGTDPAFAAPIPSAPLSPGPRPTFSVVVAVYDGAAVVAAAVRSALDQSEPPLEVLVADDGSSDNLADAIAPFGDAVRMLRLPHRGAASASNAAVAEAVGDFVVVLDADDTWAPRRLARLGDLAAARPDLDLLTTDAWFVVNGQRQGRFYEHNAFATDDQSTEILRRTFFFAHVAVRRMVWLAAGGFAGDLARGYDWDLQLRLLLDGVRAGCVLEPLADYAIHPESLSAARYESLMARVRLLDRAATMHSLDDVQRVALNEARASYRRRALIARAEQLLIDGAPGRRRASAAVALATGVSVRRRMQAAAGAVAPGWTGNRLSLAAARRGRPEGDRAL
jgi:glycosyltransferase involved in cell wall biosynthesis